MGGFAGFNIKMALVRLAPEKICSASCVVSISYSELHYDLEGTEPHLGVRVKVYLYVYSYVRDFSTLGIIFKKELLRRT